MDIGSAEKGKHRMEKRKLGNSGLEIAPIAFGGNIFGWTVDEPTSFGLLDAFVGAGFNCIDTADVYSRWVPGNRGGESETIIGKWLKRSGNREKVVIATKVGKEMGPTAKGLSKAYVLRAVEDSLKRLQTDRIDLYQSHDDDPETPLEETLEAYAQLIRQGKVRAIGASNHGAGRLSEALEVSRRKGYPSYASLQPLYNLYDRREYERELEPVCRREGLGVLPYFSLASGFLTGKYRRGADVSKSARARYLERYLNDRGFHIVDALEQAAREHHATPARVALAWLIARPGVTAAIASATNMEQMNELTRAPELALAPATFDLLDRASAYE